MPNLYDVLDVAICVQTSLSDYARKYEVPIVFLDSIGDYVSDSAVYSFEGEEFPYHCYPKGIKQMQQVLPPTKTGMSYNPSKPVVTICKIDGNDISEIDVIPAVDFDEGQTIYTNAVAKFSSVYSDVVPVVTGTMFDEYEATTFNLPDNCVISMERF